MKTVLEEVSPVKKKLIIEIEADEIDKRVDKAFRQFGKKAKLRGFRPGKIPRKILESYFGDQVLEDVTNSLIKETLPEAMDETSTLPLSVPVVENEVLKIGQNYKYSAVMEVRPEFELKEYLGIEAGKEKCVVTDEDVARQIEEIRIARGNLKPVIEDRGIGEGDYAIIDYEAFEGDRAVEGIKSENFSLNIGKKKFYPGIEEALIGSKKGDDKEIKVDFEDNYFHSKLAGKSVRFRVHIKEIKEAELPELNDEFAKGLGGKFSGLDDLKKKVREELIEREEKRIDRDLQESILKKISESVEFELPESLVEPEIQSSIENIKQNLIRAGSSIDKSGLDETKLKEEIRPAAEKSVKNMLILGEIAKQNNLSITEDDLTKGFEEMSRGIGHEPQEIRRYYEANNLMDAFRQTLLKEKTLKFLVENAKVTEVDPKESNDK